MGKLYKRDKSGKVLSIAEIVQQRKTNNRNLVPPVEVPKTGKIVQRNVAPKATEQSNKIKAKSQPANEIVLKQTVNLPDAQKTATFTNYRKAIDFLNAEAQKPGFTIAQLEGIIAGEVRTTVIKAAEKIRAEIS